MRRGIRDWVEPALRLAVLLLLAAAARAQPQQLEDGERGSLIAAFCASQAGRKQIIHMHPAVTLYHHTHSTSFCLQRRPSWSGCGRR
jgi:uncharacterized membrane protein YhhN